METLTMTALPPVDLSDLFTDLRRTIPWADDEFVRVDGHRLVYTAIGTEFLVRLPGGRAASVEQLQAEGHVVTLPKRVRK